MNYVALIQISSMLVETFAIQAKEAEVSSECTGPRLFAITSPWP